MNRPVSLLSTDQVQAFVELARCGSIRMAAKELFLSEEGLRSRLLALEGRLGVSLYVKERGRRTGVELTHVGQAFLNKSVRFIEEAQALTEPSESSASSHKIKLVTSQYLLLYMLVDMMRDFQSKFPNIAVDISTRAETQVVSTLRTDTNFTIGICSPEEYPTDLVCRQWFSMGWRFIAPLDNPLLQKSSVAFAEIANEPLIVFEPGTTGRQHVLEAFYRRNLTPRIITEATSAQIAVRMVEAGLGVAIVPVPHSDVLTRGINVGESQISDPIRPIENVIFCRAASQNEPVVQTFLNYACHEPLSILENIRTKSSDESKNGISNIHVLPVQRTLGRATSICSVGVPRY